MPEIVIHSDPNDNGLVYAKVAGTRDDGTSFEVEGYFKRDVPTRIVPELLTVLKTATVVKSVKTAEGKTTHKEFPAYAISVVKDD